MKADVRGSNLKHNTRKEISTKEKDRAALSVSTEIMVSIGPAFFSWVFKV